ncbi:MAG: 3-methyl-2-oxobutanoate dehydrogenase subunit alpha [Ktedonobacteraceae bacterium]
MSSSTPSSPLTKNLYERMLLTRLVDEYICHLYTEDQTTTFVSCRGYEAAQVGSAVCIEVGQDFTLPCSRDLGVLLAIGMTPYEVFCTHLNNRMTQGHKTTQEQVHWSYHKHNTVTGPAPVATQILHAAGIAFASKLRKVPVVTVAYCGDDVVSEPDFLEGIRFAALHHLPIIFICEHDCHNALSGTISCLTANILSENLAHQYVNGADVIEVYETMQHAMQHTRKGQGPILLEVFVSPAPFPRQQDGEDTQDPLTRCRYTLQAQGDWDEEWAAQLHTRLLTEVEQAMRDALRDTQGSKGEEV